jgi:hypothetical protein
MIEAGDVMQVVRRDEGQPTVAEVVRARNKHDEN